MNAQLLIDAVVRQTTVLIAQLATTGGIRAPVAHLANRIFLDLARELDAQGVSRKVSADMFGMALRAYLRKIQRLTESARRAAADDSVGGSTYTFQVWPGHPLEEEVRSTLARFRAEHSALRARVRAVNDASESVPEDAYEVVVYGGQHILREEEGEA